MKSRMSSLLIAIVVWVQAAPSAPAAATAACGGDCSGDGAITIDDLIVIVNIALGGAPVEQCRSIDIDGNREVTIEEIIIAVGFALDGCPPPVPRLIALSRDGRIASIDIAAPWSLRASGDLHAAISSARCRDGRCLVVHPSPANSISIVDASTLSVAEPITLPRGSDPRDVALVDDHTAVVSQYGTAELLEIDLTTRAMVPIDLSALADADGLAEALRLASCGRRVFAQLLRVDHETGTPAAVGAVLAVIDLDRSGTDRIVDADPVTDGVQGIALAVRPNFDMPVDCEERVLYVAEPIPLMQGGGGYEQVDLDTLTASEFPFATGAEVGGFEVVEPNLVWLITHTDFGPGASSHLTLVGGASSDTHNTFASEHVNDVALDRDEDLLFFPDPCMPTPANQSCDTGIHIFHAHTGERASAGGVDVGFAPIEVVVAR